MSTLARPLLVLFSFALTFVSLTAAGQTDFGSVNVGSSATETVTVELPTATTLTAINVVTMGAIGLDFTDAGTGTCKVGMAYNATHHCTVVVTFSPLYAGQRKGGITLSNSSGVYLTAFVQGIGNAPQLAFMPGLATAFSPTFEGFPPAQFSLASLTNQGIAVDGAGTIYIAAAVINKGGVNIAADGVLEIPAGSTTATLLTALGSEGAIATNPLSVRVDGAGDRIINDGANFTISIPQGATSGAEFGQLLAPAVDGAGNLFEYQPFNGDGTFSDLVFEFPLQNSRDLRPLSSPNNFDTDCFLFAQALDAAGNLFIADCTQVLELSASQLVPHGPKASATVLSPVVDGLALTLAADIAFDGASNLFVADLYNNRILELPSDGGTPFAIDPVVDGKGLSHPSGLAFDLAGNLYILDSGNQRVVEIHSQPPVLNFEAGGVGSPSLDSPQTVPVQNVGTAPLIFSSLAFPSDFPEQSGGANACTTSTSLNPGQICNLNIDFAPLTDGNLSEAVELTDNSLNQAGAMQSISVNGTDISAVLSPLSLSYGTQELGTRSPSQQTTLTNALNTPLNLVGIHVIGTNASSFDFGSDCPMILASQASCTIHGHFIPQVAGPISATLLIQHHDAGPPQMVTLTGTGLTPPMPTVSDTSLAFGTQAVGTASASQDVTLTNSGQLPFTINGITTTGPNAASFLFASDCPGNLFAGQSCTVHGHFTPAATGPLAAMITILTTTPPPFQTIALTGTGH